jgi:hypothetical protein
MGLTSLQGANCTLLKILVGRTIGSDIEMVHMMRKGQAKYACRSPLSLAEQFNILAA